jgi:hypothetical protein
MTVICTLCEFCNGKHITRNCPVELKLAPEIKKIVGNLMEYYFCNSFSCPGCKNKTLSVLGNNKPSLDIICLTCSKKIEVKSKCLSINNLPRDIVCHGGNYNQFINNIENLELDLVVIIYGVNRKKKEIYIRKVYYIPNNILYNSKLVTIDKCINSSLSIINIKNIEKLNNIIIKSNQIISFKNIINKFLL